MKIVVVESPAKAKTINKYLGPGYEVLASFGHVRDLPAKDGSVDPDHDFKMLWEVDDKSQQAAERHRPRRQRRRRPDPRHRPRPRGRGDLLARAGSAQGKERAEGADGRARRVQRHHQAGGRRRDEEPAPDRRRAGRRLSRPPRARLSRRLHAVAGAVAQAARRALGRPGAVGGAAACLRPRARDREVRRPRILVAGRDARDAAQRDLRGAPRRRRRPEDHSASTSARARKPSSSSAIWRARPSPSIRSRPSPRGATPIRRSRPRPCSRRRAASSASRRRTPCGSRSGSTKASRSAARPSASSPICEPTASTSRPRRSPRPAASSRRDYGKQLRAVLAAPVRLEVEERAGGARGDPPDRPRPAAQGRPEDARSRPGPALRADLDAHHRQPDGIRRARAHHGRHHRQGRRAAPSTCAPPARW